MIINLDELRNLSERELTDLIVSVQEFNNLKYWEIGEGSTSVVFTEGKYAYKATKPYHDEDTGEIYLDAETCYHYEFSILEGLEEIGIYPKPVYSTDNILCMERIQGLDLSEIIDSQIKEITKESIESFIESIYQTYKLGYEPRDLHLSNVKITEENKLYIVDVGFFRKADNPVYLLPQVIEILVRQFPDLEEKAFSYFGKIMENN